MGCSLCGIFNPAICGPLCGYAGLSCGTLGYICEPAPKVPREHPTVAEDNKADSSPRR